MDEQERFKFSLARPGCLPAFLTAAVAIDFERRFEPGRTMRSNLITNFDLQNMVAITDSGSVYRLQGRGSIADFDWFPETDEQITEAVEIEILKGYGVMDYRDLPDEEKNFWHGVAVAELESMELSLDEAYRRYLRSK